MLLVLLIKVFILFKAEVEKEVNQLKKLKADFLAATGKEWKPDQQPPPAAAAVVVEKSHQLQTSAAQPVAQGTDAKSINDQIVEQGNKIRQLKSDKAAKVVLYT